MPSVSRLLPVVDMDKDGVLSQDEIRAASKRWPKLAGLLGGGSGQPSPAPRPEKASTKQPVRRLDEGTVIGARASESELNRWS